MPFNGSGVFQRVRNWVADAAAGIKIRADYHDAEDDGFAQGLTNCITKDGQTIVTQNIPMNSKRITGLEDPVNPQDASTKAYTDTKMPLAGGTLTGDLLIRKNRPAITLDDTGTAGADFHGKRNDKQRWLMRLGNGDPETGANVGSNFDLHNFADDGSHLGTALHFHRVSGLGVVAGDPTDANGIATKGYTDTKDAALLAQINTKQASLGFTPVQQGGGAGQVGNKVYIGWSGTQLKAQVDGTDLGAFFFGVPPTTGATGARLALLGDAQWFAPAQLSEPYPTSGICTGLAAATGYSMAGRFRALQLLIGGSYVTVGYG